jgi:di/tricarboxylate transporter
MIKPKIIVADTGYVTASVTHINALTHAFSGFSTSAVALVAAALFLAAAMQETQLHKIGTTAPALAVAEGTKKANKIETKIAPITILRVL